MFLTLVLDQPPTITLIHYIPKLEKTIPIKSAENINVGIVSIILYLKGRLGNCLNSLNNNENKPINIGRNIILATKSTVVKGGFRY